MWNISILASHPIRPKAPSATSIPAILKSLQDEWVSNVELKVQQFTFISSSYFEVLLFHFSFKLKNKINLQCLEKVHN